MSSVAASYAYNGSFSAILIVMSEDQFTKLFKYVQEQFALVNEKLDEKASQSSLDKLTNTLDGFVARIDHYETELAARDHKIARLERWIEEIAKQTGVKLPNV